jgi:hypothetical protein
MNTRNLNELILMLNLIRKTILIIDLVPLSVTNLCLYLSCLLIRCLLSRWHLTYKTSLTIRVKHLLGLNRINLITRCWMLPRYSISLAISQLIHRLLLKPWKLCKIKSKHWRKKIVIWMTRWSRLIVRRKIPIIVMKIKWRRYQKLQIELNKFSEKK